jgi:Hint domain-containing protein
VSWIGLNDRQTARFDPRGITCADAGVAASQPRGALAENALPQDTLLCQGSLVVETRFDPARKQPQILISLARELPWPCGIALQISETGQLCWLHRQGRASSKGTLDLNLLTQPDRLRISYCWDAPARSAALTVLDLDSGQALTTPVADPAPLLTHDLARIILDPGSRPVTGDTDGHMPGTPDEHANFLAPPHTELHPEAHLGRDLRLIALADQEEPALMAPTLAGDTLIDTEYGARPVRDLHPGDLICLANGDIAPLRGLVTRQLPARGWFAPVELRAPFFRLRHNLRVAQDHQLLLTGPDADYLFGESHHLVKARHLLHHNGARLCPGLQQTLYQLLFDDHYCVQAGGIGSESLFTGQIAAQPALLARSALAQTPARQIPRHEHRYRPVLGRFETETLLRATSV